MCCSVAVIFFTSVLKDHIHVEKHPGLLWTIELSDHRADRTSDSGKSRGGGLCVYTNNKWCTNVVTMGTHCSPDLEYLSVRCRHFYLIITAVYIPPDANTTALDYLLTAIGKQQRDDPDGV